MYIDDVRLYRPCDEDSACWAGTGQICPLVINSPAPNNPLKVRNIGNAKSMRIRLFVPGQNATVWDTTYTNQNGLPDIIVPAKLLATRLASRQYDAEITLENACGALRTATTVDIMQGLYTPTDSAWVDSTANWTRSPVPCCLSTLTLENMQIVGDVHFQVRDSIIVRGGVSAAPGSDVLLLAPDVQLLDSVTFDGTVSDVTITEAPCVNRMANPGQQSAGNPPRPPKPDHGKPEIEAAESEALEAEEIAMSETNPFHVAVGPNPFEGKLFVGIEVFEAGRGEITLYNAQMVAMRRIVEGEWMTHGARTFSVDTEGLAAGLYLLRVEIGNVVMTEKVIKR